MMNVEVIRSYVRRWANIAWEFLLAMDTDPVELLHEDICALKNEVVELRRQVDEAPKSQRHAA